MPHERIDEVIALVAEVFGRPPSPERTHSTDELRTIRAAGILAAEIGLGVGEAVELYLSAALDTSGGTDRVVVSAVREAIPVLVQGHQSVGQALLRQEAVARVEFIDDLLRGDADIASLVQRAEPFGLDLSASHQVILATPRSARLVEHRDRTAFNRVVVEQYGDRGALVTTMANNLVAVVPGTSDPDVDEPARSLQASLRRADPRSTWRFAVGRPYSGPYGVARSYQQAREAVVLAERLHPDADMVPTRDLLIYRVLGRDRAALSDLVENVLTPLTRARGGPGPLLDTLDAYFATREVATETARRLHVSVRTVTYRLGRVTQLTGYDASVPTQRLTLQAAVIGARLLPWPTPEEDGGRSTLPG